MDKIYEVSDTLERYKFHAQWTDHALKTGRYLDKVLRHSFIAKSLFPTAQVAEDLLTMRRVVWAGAAMRDLPQAKRKWENSGGWKRVLVVVTLIFRLKFVVDKSLRLVTYLHPCETVERVRRFLAWQTPKFIIFFCASSLVSTLSSKSFERNNVLSIIDDVGEITCSSIEDLFALKSPSLLFVAAIGGLASGIASFTKKGLILVGSEKKNQ